MYFICDYANFFNYIAITIASPCHYMQQVFLDVCWLLAHPQRIVVDVVAVLVPIKHIKISKKGKILQPIRLRINKLCNKNIKLLNLRLHNNGTIQIFAQKHLYYAQTDSILRKIKHH